MLNILQVKIVKNIKKVLDKNKSLIIKGCLTLFLILTIITIFSAAVLAQTNSPPTNFNVTDAAKEILDKTAEYAKIKPENGTTPTAAEIIGDVINIALGIVGLFFFGLVIYGGIVWLTAGGNKEKADKAVKILSESTLGILIVILAFLLANLVVFKVIDIATTSPPQAP